jgi:hypothetical protein
LLLWLVACGPNKQEKVASAIDRAQTLLSSEKCDEAIEILEETGAQPNNPVYLQVLASAYACRARFRAVSFISADVPTINANDLLRTISIMSLSEETTADSPSYRALDTALHLLLGTEASHVAREERFGRRRAGDMGVQILMLSLTQLGKFLNFYGNVDAGGVKGGRGGSTCFLNYTHPQAVFALGQGQTGACTGAGQGHPAMAGAPLRRRMCEGLTYVTNILDILTNIDLSGTSSLGSLQSIVSELQDYRQEADSIGVGYLLDVRGQAACEALIANASDQGNLERLYVIMFERGLL